MEEVFDGDREEMPEVRGEMSGPTILEDEVRQAVREMKNDKAEGGDGVVAEMVDAAGEFGIKKLTKMANRIYDTGVVPEKMKENTFIVIPKKPGTVECKEHRTIALISQVGKVILKVIGRRIKRKLMENVDEKQYGFKKGKGTRNAIFVLKMIIERAIEVQKDLYLCYIDFQKAFDTVEHGKMMEMLEEIGLDGKDTRLIRNLYWEQKATVQIGDKNTEWIQIKRGVRQGCILSPDLFSLYSQRVMDELEDLEGVKIGGRNVNSIRYADDTVLVADSEEKLQELVLALRTACAARGLHINLGQGKTEVMGITKRAEDLVVNIGLDGRHITQVQSYKYLGVMVTDDGRCGTEVRKRIGMAKTSFNNMRKVLTNMNLSMKIRLRMLKCFVWSVLLYGCEAWTLNRELRRRVEAAEMWFLRRMLRIPWTARMTNERVMELAGVRRELMAEVRKRQLKVLGHILRHDALEKDVFLGKIEGRRARGRQRMTFGSSLIEDIPGEMTVAGLVRLAQDRERWCSMVAHVNQDMALR